MVRSRGKCSGWQSFKMPTADKRQAVMVRDPLPTWERWVYWIVGVSAMAYSYWRLYIEGNEMKSHYSFPGLKTGWAIIGRDQDTSDFEWSVWKSNLGRMLSCCLVHITVSQLYSLSRCSIQMRLGLLVLCDLACVSVNLGFKVTVYMLIKVALLWIASGLLGVAGVWTMLSVFLVITTVKYLYRLEKFYLGVTTSLDSHLYLVSDGFFAIRLVSFGVRNAKLSNKLKEEGGKEKKPRPSRIVYILKVLLYLFYFPSFLHGPILQFSEFCDQIDASLSQPLISFTHLKEIIINLARIAFWGLFLELALHFLYPFEMSGVVPHLSLWAVVALGHVTGQLFMVKYVVLYGLPGQLARLDGVIPPPEPRCISWVYSFTDIWKHFDSGLYRFIRDNIYIPLGGSRKGLVRQLVASGIVFLFIYVWHGGTWLLFVWCCGNFIVGSLEALAGAWVRSHQGQKTTTTLGPAMTLRVKSMLYSPAYLASCLQTFFYLLDGHVAWNITRSVLIDISWINFGAMMTCFYACIHNALFLQLLGCTKHMYSHNR